jgi:hypothetical protein
MSIQLAIDIPDNEYKEIESFRAKRGLSMNELILEAIRFWKNENEIAKKVGIYMNGYLRIPENLKEIESRENASLPSFSQDAW